MITSRPFYAGGIDVSNHQGVFPWAEWNGFIDFAAAKATEGLTFKDGEFPYNWYHMGQLNVFRFAYHYAHPEEDPVKQATFFVNFVKQFGIISHDNFMLDLEYPAGASNSMQAWGKTPGQVSFWAWVFCTTVNKLMPGHRIVVYCNPSFAEAGNCAKLGQWGLWIAHYGVPQPVVPPPWNHWWFWQFTDRGFAGLDLDRFNGSEMELAQYCAA